MIKQLIFDFADCSNSEIEWYCEIYPLKHIEGTQYEVQWDENQIEQFLINYNQIKCQKKN